MIGQLDITEDQKVKIDSDYFMQFDVESASLILIKNSTTIWSKTCSLISSFCFVSYWIGNQKAILCDEYTNEVIGVDLALGDLIKICDLNRTQDDQIYRTEFYEFNDGVILVYEQGLVCFTRDCKVLWRIEGHSLDAICCGIDGNAIFFESEFDGRWAYKLSDGQKLI